MTTVHPAGLVIQVNRVLRQRTLAVGFERLVLEPATIDSLRTGLLWTAGGLAAAGLAAALVASWLPVHPALRVLGPLLLVAGILVLVAAIAHPRRVTLFLDREAGMHPSFLRGGSPATEAQAAAFVQTVRRAIIDFRCRPAEASETPAPPRLASTLDALLAMQREELLTEPELSRFRELALRR